MGSGKCSGLCPPMNLLGTASRDFLHVRYRAPIKGTDQKSGPNSPLLRWRMIQGCVRELVEKPRPDKVLPVLFLVLGFNVRIKLGHCVSLLPYMYDEEEDVSAATDSWV